MTLNQPWYVEIPFSCKECEDKRLTSSKVAYTVSYKLVQYKFWKLTADVPSSLSLPSDVNNRKQISRNFAASTFDPVEPGYSSRKEVRLDS